MSRCGVVVFVAVLVSSAAVMAAQPKMDRATLTLTSKVCSAEGRSLTLDPKVSTIVLDVSALKLRERPKDLMIMRKPEITFFRVPWVAGKTSYEVSSATVKPVFSGTALFPLKQGLKLTFDLMSSNDEVIVACDVQVQ